MKKLLTKIWDRIFKKKPKKIKYHINGRNYK